MSLYDDDPNLHRHKGAGRKRVVAITEETIKEVAVLSGRGLTQDQIADYLGINLATFKRRMNDFPELKKAVKSGKAKTISFVASRLIEQIKGGSTQATIFYLKTQAGWREEALHEHTESDTQTSLTINVNDPIEAAKVYQEIMRGGKP